MLPNLEKLINAESYDLPEQKHVDRLLHDSQCRGKEIWTLIGTPLEIKCGQTCETKPIMGKVEDLEPCEFFL